MVRFHRAHVKLNESSMGEGFPLAGNTAAGEAAAIAAGAPVPTAIIYYTSTPIPTADEPLCPVMIVLWSLSFTQ